MIRITSQFNSKQKTEFPLNARFSNKSLKIYDDVRGFLRRFWQFSLYYGEYIAKSSHSPTPSQDKPSHE